MKGRYIMGKHELTNDEKKLKKLQTKSNEKEQNNNAKKSKKNNTKKKKHLGLKIFLVIIVLLGIFFAKRLHDANGNILAALLGHDENTLKNLVQYYSNCISVPFIICHLQN